MSSNRPIPNRLTELGSTLFNYHRKSESIEGEELSQADSTSVSYDILKLSEIQFNEFDLAMVELGCAWHVQKVSNQHGSANS